MVAAGIALKVTGETVGTELGRMMSAGLSIPRAKLMDERLLAGSFGELALMGLYAVTPLLLLTLITALGAPLVLGGWSFSTQALIPDFSRLNPLSGIARMVSLRSWVELTKSLGKFALVGGAGVLVIWLNMDELMSLGRESLQAAIGHSMAITGEALIFLTGALVLIAAIDVPFQIWEYNREMRMTRDEIRQENKESEGSPEVRGRIRAQQREMAERRMMNDVPKADVIVVNPTHYAVALRYDDRAMRAPTVVAKGVDLMAARIREVASEHKVPIFEAPPLARALHRSVEIGDEIPADLYVAVAQVLTYIFQLRAAQRDRQSLPTLPKIELPDA
jgi:flagellar biosynthetic protein FlhB